MKDAKKCITWQMMGCFFRKCRLRVLIICFIIISLYLIHCLYGTVFKGQSFRYQSISLHTTGMEFGNRSALDSLSLLGTDTNSTTCIHPNLPMWNKDIYQYLEEEEPIVCVKEKNWVDTANGKFFISYSAQHKHGQIVCAYVAIVNANDSFSTLTPIVPMVNGSDLLSDAFKVSCRAADGQMYANIHACISKKYEFRQLSSVNHTISSNENDFNVLIFGFDSLSRQMVKRLLPKTHMYFTETLGGNILEGYNIVGDGTPQNLMPILTGKRETDIPEVRRGKSGAKHVDEVLEFIWNRYEKRNYITHWAEDMANIGTFQYRMLGFKNQPVHHYLRPFYLSAIPIYSKFNKYCLGSKPRHNVYLDWLKEALEHCKNRKFFMFGFFSEYSHENNNPVRLTDEDNVQFLKYLKNQHILENTVLIVMSDHGVRYGSIRLTEQGKLEERMPYFGVYVPRRFREHFPLKYENFISNTKGLVTPFDIHQTLLDLIDEKATTPKPKAYSLFERVPRNRTCFDAGIEPHWCACLNWKPLLLTNFKVLMSVNSVLSLINNALVGFSSICHVLSVKKLVKAISLQTDYHVLKFRQSLDADGRTADMSDLTIPTFVFYQITFETQPGSGIFEATTLINLNTNSVAINETSISRLSRYGDEPKCVQDKYPALRPYCVCKT